MPGWTQKSYQNCFATLKPSKALPLGVTILSDVTYRPFSVEGLRIETRPLSDGLPYIEIGLAWDFHKPLSEASNTFKTFMQLTFGGPASGVRVL
jgi:hypothetical protein